MSGAAWCSGLRTWRADVGGGNTNAGIAGGHPTPARLGRAAGGVASRPTGWNASRFFGGGHLFRHLRLPDHRHDSAGVDAGHVLFCGVLPAPCQAAAACGLRHGLADRSGQRLGAGACRTRRSVGPASGGRQLQCQRCAVAPSGLLRRSSGTQTVVAHVVALPGGAVLHGAAGSAVGVPACLATGWGAVGGYRQRGAVCVDDAPLALSGVLWPAHPGLGIGAGFPGGAVASVGGATLATPIATWALAGRGGAGGRPDAPAGPHPSRMGCCAGHFGHGPAVADTVQCGPFLDTWGALGRCFLRGLLGSLAVAGPAEQCIAANARCALAVGRHWDEWGAGMGLAPWHRTTLATLATGPWSGGAGLGAGGFCVDLGGARMGAVALVRCRVGVGHPACAQRGFCGGV